MNINNSILLTFGYGLISNSKPSESITHHYNSPLKLNNSHIKKIRLGFIQNRELKNSIGTLHSFSPEDSSNLSSNVDSETLQNQDSSGNCQTDHINEDLANLISAHSEIIKKGGSKESLSKYEWFDDEAVDTSDEEFMVEYYERKMPDYKTIYKHLDPVGIRNYVPNYSSEKFLGRVYEVGKSLIKDNKSQNTYSYQEVVEKVKQNKLELIEKERECRIRESRKHPLLSSKSSLEMERNRGQMDDPLEIKKEEIKKKYDELMKKVPEQTKEEEDYVEQYEGVEEFEVPKDVEGDSENVALEDDMCRFFVEVPLKTWVRDEVRGFKESLEKLEKSRKYYSPLENERFVTDFRRIFENPPLATVGIFDGDEQVESISENEENVNDKDKDPDLLDEMEFNRMKDPDIYIKEYNHNDLLNDIEKYESSVYPEIVEKITEKDHNQPIFTLKGENEGNTNGVNIEDGLETEEMIEEYIKGRKLKVYTGVPKEFIKFGEVGSVVISDSLIFKRSYDVCTGKVLERIPIQDKYYSATVVLPNQAGFRDQNIRYLADELAVNTKGLVFVPDLPVIGKRGEEWYFVLLNRLFKLIQIAYKVDRVSIVALGDQGNLILNYINQSMGKTISHYESLYSMNKDKGNKDKENKGYDENKRDPMVEFLETFATDRAQDLIRRQSVPIIEDLLNGIENIKISQSHKVAKKAKDANIVKPLSMLLQSLVLYDTCNIDFEQMIRMSIPTLVLQSNRTNIIEGVLSSESPSFLKVKGKRVNDINYEGVCMFDHAVSEIPEKLKKLIEKETDIRYLPLERNVKTKSEQYYITTFHKGVDIMLHIFKEASPHFYMKKPNSTDLELEALKDSLVCCANWILSWAY